MNFPYNFGLYLQCKDPEVKFVSQQVLTFLRPLIYNLALVYDLVSC